MARRNYTAEDDEFIAAHLNKWSNRRIAEALGRTESGVRYRIKKLGLTRVEYEPPKVEEVTDAQGGRLSRLLALRDLVEGEILGDMIPTQQRPSYYREYRAILAEIAELEGVSDAKREGQQASPLAEGLARLADLQRQLLERAAEP